jgi:hypothetical protein
LQIFHQFPQKNDISASNVTAILLLQKIRQNKNSNENGIFCHFKIAVSLQAELGCKTCKSKTNLLILDKFKTVLFSLAGAGQSDFLPSQKSYQKIYFDSHLIHSHSFLGVKPTHFGHYFKKTNHLVCQ